MLFRSLRGLYVEERRRNTLLTWAVGLLAVLLGWQMFAALMR